MWKVTFNETGGYDCLSPAYWVGNKSTDEHIVVDTKGFGWSMNANSGIPLDEHRATVLSRCEVVATAIAAALNILE